MRWFRSKRRSRVLATALVLAAGFLFLQVDPADARGVRGRGHGVIRVAPSPFFYGSFYYPHYWGPRFYPPFYPYGPVGESAGLQPAVARALGVGALKLNVKPRKAEVFVDGEFVGQVRNFDGYPSLLWLEEGTHRITIYRGGFKSFEDEIEFTPGIVRSLKVRLLAGESEPPSADSGSSASVADRSASTAAAPS
jgi:hypothetical protein